MKPHVTAGSSVEWCTPPEIIEPIRAFFEGSIDLDPCANSHSLVKPEVGFSLPYKNGLKESWALCGASGTDVFVNPPFGKAYLKNDLSEVMSAKEWTAANKFVDFDPSLYTSSSIKDWIQKAMNERDNKVNSIFLIPAAVGTSMWQKLIFPNADAVCFIKGRVNYLAGGKPIGPAPMDCALVCFDYGWVWSNFQKAFSKTGTCINLKQK